jgi:AP-1 complex subunit gamma-1
VFNKVPDMIPDFLPRIAGLLSDKSHSVLLTGLTLMVEVCNIMPALVPRFNKMVPGLVKLLRKLVMSPTVPEYDIGGVVDPFLQAKILQMLRVLGKGDPAASEAMNTLLAQVATSTDANKNAGNAILYETVQTIMNVESESGLRVLAVNILGRFLINKDNNIRSVFSFALCCGFQPLLIPSLLHLSATSR